MQFESRVIHDETDTLPEELFGSWDFYEAFVFCILFIFRTGILLRGEKLKPLNLGTSDT